MRNSMYGMEGALAAVNTYPLQAQPNSVSEVM